MAGELIWSRAALDDIEAIAAFVARDSAIQARRLVEHVFQGAERLLIRPTLDQRRASGAQRRDARVRRPGIARALRATGR
ncbi:MAG: type II toxin-antitoxin system RelE/ParE family toxin [Chromatiales bacterium]|nr:type II toxin-antitoxin system RelE/ParE family toxin [Chromatiales bacterium]